VRIVFEASANGATYLPLGVSAEAPLISPDGRTLVFRSSLSGQSVLYSYNLDELVRERPRRSRSRAPSGPKRF